MSALNGFWLEGSRITGLYPDVIGLGGNGMSQRRHTIHSFGLNTSGALLHSSNEESGLPPPTRK